MKQGRFLFFQFVSNFQLVCFAWNSAQDAAGCKINLCFYPVPDEGRKSKILSLAIFQLILENFD